MNKLARFSAKHFEWQSFINWNDCYRSLNAFKISQTDPLIICEDIDSNRALFASEGLLPVDAFVVVVGVEELHLLEGLGAGETAGDGRMHQEEEVECRSACVKREERDA